MFEFPPAVGKIPPHRTAPHRTDTGTFLLADAYGAARAIYVKDVDGIYTCDPATAAEGAAEMIPRVGAGELLAMDHDKEIQIVNGLVRGNLTRALRGEHVGTIIYTE